MTECDNCAYYNNLCRELVSINCPLYEKKLKNKFKMELTWHNCKNQPPKEDENDFLILTDGQEVFKGTWDKLLNRYYAKYDGGFCLPLSSFELDKWWWADIVQTVRNTSRFKEVLK